MENKRLIQKDESNYILETLFSLQDKDYAKFQNKLIPTISSETIIGVRTPLLRKFAKELSKTSMADSFIGKLPHYYYEENNFHAFLLEQISDFDSAITETNRFLSYIDNWATCDSFNPKMFSKNKERLFPYIVKWLKAKPLYTQRFAIGMMMRYFLDDAFKVDHLNMVGQIRSDEYYLNMMRAWYFSTALAKQPEMALKYLKETDLDVWTLRKTIQKALESFRVSNETKQELKKMASESNYH